MKSIVNIALQALTDRSAKVGPREIRRQLDKVPLWSLEVDDGVEKIVREFRFSDYPNTMGFANCVAEIADSEGHHPTLVVTSNTVKVYWWTADLKGLHKNDFLMAAKIDQLL